MNVGIDKLFWTRWRAALVMAIVALALVFSQGTSLAAAKKSLVDINTASLAELEAVKGVGPAIANKIIANRPYMSLDELSKAGLSAKKIESFKSSLTVGGALSPAAPEAAKEEKKRAKETKKKGEAAPTTQGKEQKAAEPGFGAPVDLNTADRKALEALPGVGPAMARKIIAARPFKSVDDLSKIKGMSQAKVETLKDKVTVGQEKAAMPEAKPAPAPAPAASPAAGKPAVAKEPASPAKPVATEKGKGGAAQLAPGQKVNLNTASKEDLDKLPEIGPVKAQAIIEGRPYQKIEDVMKVKGIKEGIFEKIKDHITVD
ncbi:MAG: helix-hairpin-helix domain-containing protein [Desulfobaccales bacterium]|jgi:competence protein ComEA